MTGIPVQLMHLIQAAARGHIDLAANDGFDARTLAGTVEINHAVHDTVIRNGHGSLPQFLYPIHELADATGTV